MASNHGAANHGAANGSLSDQILANRQKTWDGVGRLLFWGTIYALILAALTVMFTVGGASAGKIVFAVIVIVVGLGIVTWRMLSK